MKAFVYSILFGSILWSYAALACEDSDGGKVPTKAGQVVYSPSKLKCALKSDLCLQQMTTVKDRCVDEKTVQENFCHQDLWDQVDMSCPQGTVCKEGACIKPSEQKSEASSQVKSIKVPVDQGFQPLDEVEASEDETEEAP